MYMEKKKTSFFKKLKNKYRLVVMNDQTFEEKLSFKLSRLNVFVLFGTLSILLIVLTIFIIAFTPLKEYIPGYADFDTRYEISQLMNKADSLAHITQIKSSYINNIKNILEGNEILEEEPLPPDARTLTKDIEFRKSPADSILRREMESLPSYELTQMPPAETALGQPTQSIRNFFFFPPLRGTVTNNFNPAERHFGVDIVAPRNEAIKATLDGTVVLSAWTLETGYTIVIQHQSNLLSVYKHNSVLLKKEGDFVRAGEVIAIIGETGLFTTGIHLHFELWFNGMPVNPREYISF